MKVKTNELTGAALDWAVAKCEGLMQGQIAIDGVINFNDDPNLEALRQDVEGKLIKHPDALRNDPDLRRDTAAEAKKIMDAMSVFMGAK